MVSSQEFVKKIKEQNLGPIIEVPCSIFEDLINYILDFKEIEIINPVNEAIVMANAAGEYLATGKIPIIMMQNSGLNNTLNALTSLNKQYEIPAVYIISWRGEFKDAEEHNFMGRRLKKILETFDIPFKILTENFHSEIEWAASLAKQLNHPTALIMKEKFIDKYERIKEDDRNFSMDRGEAIEIIVENSTEEVIYISTTGFPSRQLYNILKQRGKNDGRQFPMVGSMGHALGIGQRIAKNIPNKKIIVVDGDGGALMHLGSMAGTAEYMPHNLIHVILDNGAYCSTGKQPTQSKNINFEKIGNGFGYNVHLVQNKEQLVFAIRQSLYTGPSLIHIKINQKEMSKTDSRMERVEISCKELKEKFANYLKNFR